MVIRRGEEGECLKVKDLIFVLLISLVVGYLVGFFYCTYKIKVLRTAIGQLEVLRTLKGMEEDERVYPNIDCVTTPCRLCKVVSCDIYQQHKHLIQRSDK